MEFAKHYPVIGYDVDLDRISKLKKGIDSTMEVSSDELINIQLADNQLFGESIQSFSTSVQEGFMEIDGPEVEKSIDFKNNLISGLLLSSDAEDISDAN